MFVRDQKAELILAFNYSAPKCHALDNNDLFSAIWLKPSEKFIYP